MKRKKIIVKARVPWFLSFVLALVICPAWVSADWQKIDPPPDVDKSAHDVAPYLRALAFCLIFNLPVKSGL